MPFLFQFWHYICIEILAIKLRSDPQVKGFKMNENLHHLLELYADDCTIFLQPCSVNLRNTIRILDNFYKLSGLKISVTKTKAIWFGTSVEKLDNICTDLNLDWVQNFRLLGVDFDKNLENMAENYTNKVGEIKKVLNSWLHRSLSVYGKICVIKTLALPKLSHLALVLPSLSDKQIKELEKIIYNFMWNGKPDKVSRLHAKAPENMGGLGMVDIKHFWIALKFSWLRRLGNTKAFWPLLFIKSIEKIHGNNLNIPDLLQMGPNFFDKMSKLIKNPFWSQVLGAVSPLMQGAMFCYPEKIVTAPFWGNPNILRGNRPIKKDMFPILANKVKNVADLYIPGTAEVLTRDWMEMHNLIVAEEVILEIKYILKQTFNKLGLGELRISAPLLPYRPLLIEIANMSQKGCSHFCKLLKGKLCTPNIMRTREEKWHLELGYVLGRQFWIRTYNLTATIKYDNKLKWLQYQICRNSLFTNVKVHKVHQHISPLCTYCESHEELIGHLFYSCNKITQLWSEIVAWLAALNINLKVTEKVVLFGINSEESTSVLNTVILSVKHFIWITKFGSKNLSVALFQKYFFKKLQEKKDAFVVSENTKKFECWLIIYDNLSRLLE